MSLVYLSEYRKSQPIAWLCGCGSYEWLLYANGDCVCARCFGTTSLFKVEEIPHG